MAHNGIPNQHSTALASWHNASAWSGGNACTHKSTAYIRYSGQLELNRFAHVT